MAGKTTPVVFITANVGSIFEEPNVMLKIWTQEFLSTISCLDPKFVALHCQEVGGKNYEKSMKHVEDFVKLLINSEELRLFDKVRIYLDEDYSSAENFTALGNFYFIHESITDALIFDFEQRRFVEIEGKAVYSKNIEEVRTKEKSKFPLEYFPECKWSRKGFLRTRWCLNGTIFDLVNIHLFHDVSNFVAIKSFPSVYSDIRRRALAYTLERFQTDEYGPVPFFVFGDFNFRTDTQGVVKHLSEGLKSSCQSDEFSIIQFKREDEIVFSLGKKEFNHSDHQEIFTLKDGNWLREFDKELEAFSDQLFEFEISFPPSYPFEENSSGDKCYMKTRCPAWCDRVILSHSAIPLVKDSSDPGNVTYTLMGRNTCMGDHKPVYLKFDINDASAKNKEPHLYSSSTCENQEKMSNGLISNTDSEEKNDSGKSSRAGLKYSELQIEKLACSLEALMSQNSSLSRELEANIEPDLSRCPSCRMHQNASKVVNNPGGEEISRDNLILEDKKIIALLASEIKVPEDLLQKIEIQDTGQRSEKETCSWECKSSDEKLEKFGAVKRVNSASLVEHPAKKEDWKNSRCNSDVAWSPSAHVQNHNSLSKSWKGSKQFNKGNSRIRLISSSNSLNESLPRLTSHHSSSEEEWFEEVEEYDDDDDDVLCTSSDQGNEREESVADIYPEFCGQEGDGAKEVKAAAVPIEKTIENISANVAPNADSCVEVADPKIGDLAESDEVPEGEGNMATEDGASRMNGDSKSKSKPLSILKRLTEGRKESFPVRNKTLADSGKRESFETLIVDPTVAGSEAESAATEEATSGRKSERLGMPLPERKQEFNIGIGDVKKTKDATVADVTVSTDSWETIELGGKKSKESRSTSPAEKNSVAGNRNCNRGDEGKKRKCAEGGRNNCCCVLQ